MANKRPLATGGASGIQEVPDADTVNLLGGLSVGTASAPDASTILDIVSTTKGLGLPSVTTAQKLAIASPREGAEVYDSSLKGVCTWDGEKWYRQSQKTAATVAAGAGAGTSPIITITGTDLGGTVTLTTGTSPTTGGALFTITFNTAFEVVPKGILFTEIDLNAKTQSVNYTQNALATGSCGLTMNAGRTAAAASTYTWAYWVVQ